MQCGSSMRSGGITFCVEVGFTLNLDEAVSTQPWESFYAFFPLFVDRYTMRRRECGFQGLSWAFWGGVAATTYVLYRLWLM